MLDKMLEITNALAGNPAAFLRVVECDGPRRVLQVAVWGRRRWEGVYICDAIEVQEDDQPADILAVLLNDGVVAAVDDTVEVVDKRGDAVLYRLRAKGENVAMEPTNQSVGSDEDDLTGEPEHEPQDDTPVVSRPKGKR